MIYVTGDLHGDLDRLKTKAVARLRSADYLVVCGDFGFLWSGSKEEQKALKWIGSRKFTTLFVDGCHDNLDLLAAYPEQAFQGGLARHITGRLHCLSRGTVVTLGDQRLFAMGGGESPDMEHREPGVSWWADELPQPQVLEEARARLAALDNQVDYIVTHDCSSTLQGCLSSAPDHINHLSAFFDQLQTTCRFKRWFFGCYHLDRTIPPHYRAIYQDVVPVMEK